ncbi:PEP-CTERM sorting domain-containing protein [Erythrobacter sp. 3-20A1M]|uniref:PEPxxWA-CTERM sorting domain-containing protein n=1 Tax=Erythrobacter sp. 3-20A1M TaxID=2653850 RepID=UPI001BFC4D47|nr:PEPxxWA-CTERM sorting domain-containing protein [Erythrobacter sp. 3-20A1M]QWC55996.1 PEP-CTERM sorting domain-containing protein [Erythrobacter sp. 3-20A1M]
MKRITSIAAIAILASVPGTALAEGRTAAPSYTLTNTTYTQNFDSLARSGDNNSNLPAGFQIVEKGTGSSANGRYEAGSGTSNAGDVYSFGANGSSDRALGSLGSGSVAPTYFGGIFTNGLDATISDLTFSYDGEQWRAGNSNDDGLTFQYSLDATQVDNGTWTTISSLIFNPLVLAGNTALNGNLAANRVSLNGSASGLNIGSGSSFGFRWVDQNSSGSDHGLGVDNFSLTAGLAAAGGVPEPATWALMILGFGFAGGALRRRNRGFARLALA